MLEQPKVTCVIVGSNYSRSPIGYILTGSLCLLSLAACAESASQDTAATIERQDAQAAGSRSEADAAAPPAQVSPPASEPAGGEVHRAAAAPAASVRRKGLVTSRKPLIVPGRVERGKLERRDGCIVVEVEGTTFTAVFPPSARLVANANGGESVAWTGRTVPIGELTRIPGGGSVTRADLAASLPGSCPELLYAIGG
jgi:hypothetical protein